MDLERGKYLIVGEYGGGASIDGKVMIYDLGE